ncbi:hypothetical protein CA54_58620 [Symmachiella macrocystis]|uniref:Uncharacterized protein n=1 Tax=Symmachiella macrocystis TaxID=2527985 RepID=A0A5C6B3V2_9PLAN|nr:hypothetical protein [Symmachiella macrocystis]TWU05174.1 hypothetical protein CA54_58620 [Symmachiella macrocystis]
MAGLNDLTARLDAEFAEFEQGIDALQASAQSDYEARKSRFHALFEPAANRIVELARPRLQLLVERFRDRVNVQPVMTQYLREVTFSFDSQPAQTVLKFSLSHDASVKNLTLDRDLDILPILFKCDPHASLCMPLDQIDEEEITNWFDEQIVSFVKTAKEMHRNNNYLKGHLVLDPIAGVQSPKFAAKSTLESGGTTHYFISNETCQEFQKRQNPGATA